MKTQDKKTQDTGQKKNEFFFSLDRFFVFLFLKSSLFGPRHTHKERDTHRNQFHQNAHALETRSKTKTLINHGDHVREVVPASLFEERDAHFDGAREFFFELSRRKRTSLFLGGLVLVVKSNGILDDDDDLMMM